MKRNLRHMPLFAILAAALLFAIGCDEPNEPDTGAQPFRLVATYTSPGAITDLDADGNIVCAAASGYGALVFNVSGTGQPDTIFSYRSAAGTIVTAVALDLLHHTVACGSNDDADNFPVLDYETGERTTGVNFMIPINDIIAVSEENVVNYWAVDPSDGLVGTRICRDTDTSAWEGGANCGFSWHAWRPNTPPHTQGLAVKDTLAVVAIDAAGLHFYDLQGQSTISECPTPGAAYDLAWYGDNLVVADEYFLTVVDPSDMTEPSLVSRLAIDGADRMRRVAVTGHYAFVLDENDGIYVVDLANVAAPKFVQKFALPEPTDVVAADGWVYVSDAQLGLLVFMGR